MRQLARGVLLTTLLVVLLPSCTAHKAYRPVVKPDVFSPGFGPLFDEKCDPDSPIWGVAVLEFDDHGEFWDHTQLVSATGMGPCEVNTREIIMVVYVHGWKHDASSGDEDLRNFQELIAQVAKDQPVGQTRVVMGVYMAWRGNSIALPEPLKSASYYDRNAAAERVAGPATTEALYLLMRLTRHLPNSRVIVIGHSMGAKIVERAIIPAYTALLLEAGALAEFQTSESEECKAARNMVAETCTEAQGWRPPADLILLVNPASPALEAKKFIDMLTRYGFGINADGVEERQAPFVCQEGKTGWTPLIVSITSETDTANGRLFPLGNMLSKLGSRSRTYQSEDESSSSPNLPPQRYFFTRTAGFAPVLHTHKVIHQKRDASTVADRTASPCEPGECAAFPDLQDHVDSEPVKAGKVCFNVGDDRFVLQELPDRHNRTPYWIMQVPKTIMEGHSDIFNPTTYSFIRGLIELTGALHNGESYMESRKPGS